MLDPKFYPNKGDRISGVWADTDRNGLAERALVPLCEITTVSVRKNKHSGRAEVRAYTSGGVPTDPVQTVWPNGGPHANSRRLEYAHESSWLVTDGDLTADYYRAVDMAMRLHDLAMEARKGWTRTARRPA